MRRGREEQRKLVPFCILCALIVQAIMTPKCWLIHDSLDFGSSMQVWWSTLTAYAGSVKLSLGGGMGLCTRSSLAGFWWYNKSNNMRDPKLCPPKDTPPSNVGLRSLNKLNSRFSSLPTVFTIVYETEHNIVIRNKKWKLKPWLHKR